ncbi:MAG: hypothetical protein V4805_00440 [Pseudomonadota bacterium]
MTIENRPTPHPPGHEGEPIPKPEPQEPPYPPHDKPRNPAPFLVLPYDDGLDNGARPIPSTYTSWWSQALQISVDGIAYTGGQIPRDRPTKIEVKVANWGDKDSNALISLYWANPTPIFSAASLKADGLSEPVWVDVPRHTSAGPGLSLSPPFWLLPTKDMPDHVCLLAEITSGDAAAPGVLDPVGDRHTAQHNIDIVHVAAGKTASTTFQINNPFALEARVVMHFGPVSDEMLKSLSRRYRADAAPLAEDAFALQQLAEADGNRQQRELVFEMEAGEQRLCQGVISTKGMRPGQFCAGHVDVIVSPLKQEEHSKTQVGSLGVIVFAGK